MIEVKVPQVGESITEVQVGSWLVEENGTVDRDAPLVVIETDKATVEVPAPAAGRLARIRKKAGEPAKVGDVLAEIDPSSVGPSASRRTPDSSPGSASLLEEGAAAAPSGNGKAKGAPAPAPATRAAAPRGEAAPEARPMSPPPGYGAAAGFAPGGAGGAAVEAESEHERGHAGPAARRALAEYGLSPDEVEGTGPGGRITRDDVLREAARRAAAKAPAAPARAREPEAPRPAPAARGGIGGDREEEVVPMTTIRRRIAERLVDAQQTAALLTTFNECDMSAVIALRTEHKEAFQERYGVKLGFMSFFVKASVDALKAFPAVNAEVRGEDIVYKRYYDIGIAVGGGRGLVVPVIRDAHRLSFADIERTIADFGKRAQQNKLRLDELQGGTFTISNGGIYGSMLSTPIVNPPQSGILGLHAIEDRPVAREGQVVVRPMMYVALTYDHRLVDGREAVTFLKRIKDTIENPARMLLEI